jgi:hypothetical protein
MEKRTDGFPQRERERERERVFAHKHERKSTTTRDSTARTLLCSSKRASSACIGFLLSLAEEVV